jgi:3-isopropylmalate/(R)-2-methylmalate dehydratase small subunit
MSLAKITQVKALALAVPGDDIDTDRIIPARFMKCVTFDGLGEFAFYDVRKHEDGTDRVHPLNEPRFAGASVLLAGPNFGCGSSREHAPQALYRFGFRTVIAESFAEIFFGNCATLGIPCVMGTADQINALAAAVEANPALEITVDVENLTVSYGDQSFPVTTTASAREALISGKWDPIGELLEAKDAVADKMKALGWAA